MELVPIHTLGGTEGDHALAQCVRILNYEWPRSETIRLRGLRGSSDKLPCHLVLLSRHAGARGRGVVGHVRISRIPADTSHVFIESVVIHPQLRGRGLGKILMLLTEDYCLKRGFTTCYLTTHDQQIFYSRCGYNFSEAVCAFGGSSSLNIGNFAAKMTATNGAVPAPSPPVARPQPAPSSSGGGPPPPPPPPGPPPPPPSSSSSGPGGHSTPSDDLKEKCHSAFLVPTLPAELPTLDSVPEVDMAGCKERNTEDSGEKMFMKKQLI